MTTLRKQLWAIFRDGLWPPIVIVSMVTVAVLCFGCANPSYFTVRPDIGKRTWMTIAVAPFSGDPRFRDIATETFTLHMLKQTKFNVIEL